MVVNNGVVPPQRGKLAVPAVGIDVEVSREPVSVCASGVRTPVLVASIWTKVCDSNNDRDSGPSARTLALGRSARALQRVTRPAPGAAPGTTAKEGLRASSSVDVGVQLCATAACTQSTVIVAGGGCLDGKCA